MAIVKGKERYSLVIEDGLVCLYDHKIQKLIRKGNLKIRKIYLLSEKKEFLADQKKLYPVKNKSIRK